MTIYTIGFTKKTAYQFFKLLQDNGIVKVIDIRLNNKSQLAGFAKGGDLEYFLKCHGIGYEHDLSLAPTEELRKRYNDKKQKMTFADYTACFLKLLEERKAIEPLVGKNLDKYCYLCSEGEATECHRRLVVEAIRNGDKDIQIIHL